jgi:nucleotide-binding universal stress UspA family protein
MEELRATARRRLEAVHARVVDAGLEGTLNLLEGDPPTAIEKLARVHSLDLIVLGTRGNTGLKHVALGSVAERVTRLVPCSVLIAKADEGRA